MNGGDISVTVADGEWVMNGALNMANTAGDIPILSGSAVEIGNDSTLLLGPLASVNVTGAGNSQISSAVTFFSDASVNVAAGATLVLNGNATFNSVNGSDNAQFTGGGILRLDGSSSTVNEITTVNMPNAGSTSTGRHVRPDADAGNTNLSTPT